MILKENGEVRSDSNNKEFKQGKDTESDCDSARNSLSSQVDLEIAEAKKALRVSKKMTKKESTETTVRGTRSLVDRKEQNKLQLKQSNSSNTRRRPETPNKLVSAASKSRFDLKTDNVKVMSRPTLESFEGPAEKIIEEKAFDEFKNVDISDEARSCDLSAGTDNETVDMEENSLDEDKSNSYQNIEEMEIRIEKLEEELREVAALEVSLYSVVSEHGRSAHKVHTPARRLSRLYLYACKHWTQDKRATVAKNAASGLVLIAKSCGNDVARLTFWLSNVIILREIISRALDESFVMKDSLKNAVVHNFVDRTSPHPKVRHLGNRVLAPFGSFKGVEDWHETGSFLAVLERIESWIFDRAVESVWWQTLTPHMQTPVEDTHKSKCCANLQGTGLGDQRQGSFSVNLWKDAFLDAFTRLCPVRAGANECGCLPVLARKVMEQCISRLDVAMFNAILRESANQIPTDPVSDPIVDTKVLPIVAGDLSFGSGVQLKNAVGYWSRCLSDLFGLDADDSMRDDRDHEEDNNQHTDADESKCFILLNSLSDLLMLPKELLLDKSIRNEICPSIGLPLIVRILCNLTPDEFCPDPVPCAVLEDLNSESLLERSISGSNSTCSFPYIAGPVVYRLPSGADVAQKLDDVAQKTEIGGNASIVEARGYTSDEDLENLDCPVDSISDRTPPASPASGNRNTKGGVATIMRFELLQEAWSA